MSSSWKLEHSQTTVGVGRQRADQGGQRRADVPRNRHRLAGGPPQVPEELGHGRLAVGPGDRHEPVREQPPGELELAEHGDAPFARRRDDRRLRGHPGALDQTAGTGKQADPVRAEPHLHPRRTELLGALRRARIAPRDPLPALGQQPRDGASRASEPDDQVRTAGQWRSRLGAGHPIEFW